MSLQVELLEKSFEAIKPQADEFVNSFYDNLFTANPDAKPLFAGTNMAEQKKKLLDSLVLVVENLRMPEILDQALRGLGARHVKYGALPEHYPLVGIALLTTFEQYLGDKWTPEVKQAWVEAYGAISEIMLDGADYSESEIALTTPEPEAEIEEGGLPVELLEKSFEAIKPQADKFVNSFYDNLFTANPEAKPLFAGTNMEEQNKRLLNYLVLIVVNLRKPEVLDQALRGLGARHVKYGALPEHYPLVGNTLLTTFEQYLGDKWTPEVKQAWVDAYGAISEIMLDGADYSESEIALATPEPEAEIEEGGLPVELLEKSFEAIKPQADEFVNSFYDNLFTANPEAKPLFAGTNMAEQKKKLLNSLVLVVENLRNPEALDSALRGLGARHVKYGALPEHYPLVGSALLTTFEQYLKEEWTPEVKQAWVDAYGAISEIMLDGADYSESEIALATPEPEAEIEEGGLPVELLEKSFETIKPQADEFVNSFYDNLFTANPEAKPLFAGTNMAEQKKKLLNSLVLVVENLRNPEALDSALRGLGARHVKYGALPEHYPLVGSALLTTFEQYLKEEWTPEVKQAWVDAYGAISEIMLDGADYSESEIALPTPEPVAVEDEEIMLDGAESETALSTPEPVAEIEEEGLPVELLEQSFEAIKPQADEFVNSFYDNLFTANPEAKPLFAGTNMAEQKKKLLNSLVLVVENLRNPEALDSALRGLGARHVKYGALPEHYPLVGSALLTTFEQYLDDKWTPEVKQAWVDAYGAISEIMLDGADYSQQEIALDSASATQTLPETAVTPTAESNNKAGLFTFVGGGIMGLIAILLLVIL